MLTAINTVFGAVATKDIVPILTHILIYEGRMQAADGCVTIDCAFPNAIPPCAVPGSKLLQAVKACGDQPNLSITETGKLALKKGSFKAFLSTLPKSDFPIETPQGEEHSVPQDFLEVIKMLRPFVSKDASRPWSMGIQVGPGMAFATNNIILVRKELNWTGLKTIIPLRALDDLLSMQENPSKVQCNENSVTFFYKDSSWLKTQALDLPWPGVKEMFSDLHPPMDKVPHNMLEDVRKVQSFCVNQKFPSIYIGQEIKSGEGDDQAIVEGYNFPDSVFHADQLALVLSEAEMIDFSPYPRPCTFSNSKGMFGLFVGVRS